MWKITRIVRGERVINIKDPNVSYYNYEFYYNGANMVSNAVMGDTLAETLSDQLNIEIEHTIPRG